MMELHWLRAVDRVNSKVATLVYRYHHDLASPYLSASLCRVADHQLTPTFFEYRGPGWLLLATVRFGLPGREHGTIY